MITGSALLASFALATASGQVAQARPVANTDNVRICHRTASVTNPYVLITVDQNSVGVSGANSKHGSGSHDHWATSVYTSKPSPNVFDPTKTYPANDKKWGDIIPPVDVSNNPLRLQALANGLNYNGIGALIYNGTGSYAGLCRAMNARDYYEVQKAAGVTPSAILEEMDELESPEFLTELDACGGSFAGCDPVKLGTTSISIPGATTTIAPAATTTTAPAATTTTAPATTTTTAPATTAPSVTTTLASVTAATLPPGVVLAAGKGALSINIWVDNNRNGKKSTTEKDLKNISVTIVGPNGVTKTAKTNASGTVVFTDLDPGQWSVVSKLSIPGYEKVYDSDGSVNWKSTATVEVGKVAAASFAAAESDAALPATGNSSVPLAMWAVVMFFVGLGVTSLRQRRQS